MCAAIGYKTCLTKSWKITFSGFKSSVCTWAQDFCFYTNELPQDLFHPILLHIIYTILLPYRANPRDFSKITAQVAQVPFHLRNGTVPGPWEVPVSRVSLRSRTTALLTFSALIQQLQQLEQEWEFHPCLAWALPIPTSYPGWFSHCRIQ